MTNAPLQVRVRLEAATIYAEEFPTIYSDICWITRRYADPAAAAAVVVVRDWNEHTREYQLSYHSQDPPSTFGTLRVSHSIVRSGGMLRYHGDWRSPASPDL